jgi:redox-sensitive bicupin YhaK (pirin superfamily)
MITLRRAEDRGHAEHGWLDSHHTFSFAGYHDPRHMGFGPLRVINDDRVAGGGGFPPHPHRDMEILTYVVEGELQHRDDMGNGEGIRPGDVQRMSAGKGVVHAEYNASKTEPVHFLQIWIVPRQRGLPSGYEQKNFPEAERRGRLRLVASPDGADGSVSLQQDARLYATVLAAGERVTHAFAAGRKGWLQVVTGTAQLGDQPLREGDGVAVEGEAEITLSSADRGELRLLDHP